jgi:hypothetical protein
VAGGSIKEEEAKEKVSFFTVPKIWIWLGKGSALFSARTA